MPGSSRSMATRSTEGTEADLNLLVEDYLLAFGCQVKQPKLASCQNSRLYEGCINVKMLKLPSFQFNA